MYSKERASRPRVLISLAVLFLLVLIILYFPSIGSDTDGASFIGIKHKLVLIISGSMEPTIAINSVSVMEVCGFDDIEVGDIIMYKVPGEMEIVHRVIDKVSKGPERYLRTKGDNNRFQDLVYVTPDMVKGKIVKIYNNLAPFISPLMSEVGVVNPVVLSRLMVLGIIIVGLIIVGLIKIGEKCYILNKAKRVDKKGSLEELIKEYRETVTIMEKEIGSIENLQEELNIVGWWGITEGLINRGRFLDELQKWRDNNKALEKAARKYKYSLIKIKIANEKSKKTSKNSKNTTDNRESAKNEK